LNNFYTFKHEIHYILKIDQILKNHPIHLLLLPVFFILHIYIQYAGLLEKNIVLQSWLKVTAGALILFGLLYFLFSSRRKAGVTATLLTALYLYFGNLKLGLENLPVLSFLSHFKVLLPFLFVLVILFIYLVYKSSSVKQLNLFLNILFLIYTGIEVFRLSKLTPGETRTSKSITNWQMNDPSGKPDPSVYYIVFDCYPSPSYQAEMLGKNDNLLDSFLNAKGFHIIPNSTSNYNSTVFSMAATLQMDYISWLKSGKPLTAFDYTLALQKVRHNPVIDLMKKKGYKFENFSIFDFPGSPSLKPERFLSVSTKDAIFYNTLLNNFNRYTTVYYDRGLYGHKALLEPIRNYNQKALDTFSSSFSRISGPGSVFVYAHIGMPHFPYFYNSNGKPYADSLIYGDSMITSRERFREYISYTDKKIIALIDTIMKSKRPQDIIILQSDHGIADLDWNRKKDAFRNYSAFYFPDSSKYKLLYPGMSNVNTFRVLFNAYFGQQLPLLADSSSFVK